MFPSRILSYVISTAAPKSLSINSGPNCQVIRGNQRHYFAHGVIFFPSEPKTNTCTNSFGRLDFSNFNHLAKAYPHKLLGSQSPSSFHTAARQIFWSRNRSIGETALGVPIDPGTEYPSSLRIINGTPAILGGQSIAISAQPEDMSLPRSSSMTRSPNHRNEPQNRCREMWTLEKTTPSSSAGIQTETPRHFIGSALSQDLSVAPSLPSLEMAQCSSTG